MDPNVSPADLERAFKAAQEHIKTAPDGGHPMDTKLHFYAYFKQATEGDLPANRDAPSMFNFVARQKHDTWAKMRGMSKREAALAYVDLLIKVDKSFVLPKIDAAAAATPTMNGSNGGTVTIVEPSHNSPQKKSSPKHNNNNNGGALPTNGTHSPPVKAAARPPAIPAGPDTTFVRMSIYACLGLIGVGVAGFLYFTFTNTALIFLGVAVTGISGVAGGLFTLADEHGLLAVLPNKLVHILLDSTMLELLLDDTISRTLKEMGVQVIPALIAQDEETRLKALENMSLRMRRFLTTRGPVRLMSRRMQTLILPRRLRAQFMSEDPTYRLPPAMATALPPSTLPRQLALVSSSRSVATSSSSSSSRPPTAADVEKATELMHDITRQQTRESVMRAARVAEAAVAEVVLRRINPGVLQAASAGLFALGVVQLALSPGHRARLAETLKSLVFFGSFAGSAGCAAIYVLYVVMAKRRKAAKRAAEEKKRAELLHHASSTKAAT